MHPVMRYFDKNILKVFKFKRTKIYSPKGLRVIPHDQHSYPYHIIKMPVKFLWIFKKYIKVGEFVEYFGNNHIEIRIEKDFESPEMWAEFESLLKEVKKESEVLNQYFKDKAEYYSNKDKSKKDKMVEDFFSEDKKKEFHFDF